MQVFIVLVQKYSRPQVSGNSLTMSWRRVVRKCYSVEDKLILVLLLPTCGVSYRRYQKKVGSCCSRVGRDVLPTQHFGK